jgi:hypothetical protein
MPHGARPSADQQENGAEAVWLFRSFAGQVYFTMTGGLTTGVPGIVPVLSVGVTTTLIQ